MKYTIPFLLGAGLLLQIYAGVMLYQTNKELDASLNEALKVAGEVKKNYEEMNKSLEKIVAQSKEKK